MRIERGAYFSRTVREQLLAPGRADARLIGVSAELIPLVAHSARVCPIDAGRGVSSAAFLRAHGATRGWREHRAAGGVPGFFTPDAVTLAFRTGGQIAVIVERCASIDEAIALLRQTLDPLRDAARRYGVELFSCGIDPHNNVLEAPLQIAMERDVRLATYLETLGPSGARLTRQGAGLTIHLEPGEEPGQRWRLSSHLAPYLTAIFANSRRYAGLDSGLQSYRSYCRRTLDPSRTDVPASDGDPCDAYLDFALDAIDPMRRDREGEYRSYRDWIVAGEWSPEGWELHLTTLLPDARPHGQLSLCAIDALPSRWLTVPLVLVCGLLYDPCTAEETAALVAGADEAVLWRAAALGLHDVEVAATSRDLVALGLQGAQALGEQFISSRQLGMAREFFESFTLHGRAIVDDTPAPHPAERLAPTLVVFDRLLG